MSLLSQRQNFSPSCPSGGTWYACDSGSRFVGCCNSVTSPCADTGCPHGNLNAASFDTNYFGKFPDQQCPHGSSWYSCALTDPPFLGCCKTNPCSTGCPQGDLAAGWLSTNPQIAAAYEPNGGNATATSSISSPTSIASPTNSVDASSHSSHIGTIVAGAVSGTAVLAFLVGAAIYYHRRRRSGLWWRIRFPWNKRHSIIPQSDEDANKQESKGFYHDSKSAPLDTQG